MKIQFKESELRELGYVTLVLESKGFSYLGIYERTWSFGGKRKTSQYTVFENDATGKEYSFQSCDRNNGFIEMKPFDSSNAYVVGR